MGDEPDVLDGRRTSHEWREARPTVCVLPVGAFEQHSSHLPLSTDSIMAGYFGEFVARELDAALLPTLSYGTSLEHTGLAGTFTLKPETLMQIVRDIASEAEAQGFTTMILLNSHGGNFPLTPVARDINRRNRKLKIVMAAPGAFADASVLDGRRKGLTDIHAGEYETSMMLALCPELVRDDRPDFHPNVEGFRQPDLTTFGVGFVSDSGTLGPSSLASAEKGRKLIESIKRNMIPSIKERLAWLEQNRTYSGKGRDER